VHADALIVALVLACLPSCGARGEVVVPESDALRATGVLLLRDVAEFDGRLARLRDGRMMVMWSAERPIDLGVHDAASVQHACWLNRESELSCLSLGRLGAWHKIPESPPLTFIGGEGCIRRADGSVFFPPKSDGQAVTQLPQFANATSCTFSVAVVEGQIRRREGGTVDVGGAAREVAPAFVEDPSGILVEGAFVLRQDGVVVAVYREKDTLGSYVVQGFPFIAHLKNGTFQDAEGRYWYLGVMPEGAGRKLLPEDVSVHSCNVIGSKGVPNPVPCVGPVKLRALNRAQPFFVVGELYLLYPDGELRCWANGVFECPLPALGLDRTPIP